MGRMLWRIGWLLFLILTSLLHAQAQQVPPIQQQLLEICTNIKNIVPTVALIMFLTSGLIYAAGQMMGAETRARANVWSTSMLTGGIIGLIIAASAPFLLDVFSRAAIGGTATNFDIPHC